MKDSEHHFITKAINRLRIWFSKKKRLMLQAQDLQRQLAEAWRDKAQLEAKNEALKRENYWAQEFTCPKCGPCTPAMITTWKGCLYCGEGLIRGKHPRLEELETENAILHPVLITARSFIKSAREPIEPSNLAKSPIAVWFFADQLKKAVEVADAHLRGKK